MLNKVHKFIKSLERGRNIWLLGIITGLLLVAFNLVRFQEFFATQLGYSGTQRMFAIDLEFNYSPEWVYMVLGNYGDKGREAYGYLLGGFDFIFPLIYSLFLATSLSAILSRLFPERSSWQKLSLLGLLAGMVDWLENIGILSLIINYPRELPSLANLTNIFTMTKDGFLLLNLLLLFGGGGALVVRRRNMTTTPVKHSK